MLLIAWIEHVAACKVIQTPAILALWFAGVAQETDTRWYSDIDF